MISRNHTEALAKRAVRPSLAASLLIVDTGGDEPRFLFGKRHERHRFMPGAHVFPGGRIERSDHDPAYAALARHRDELLISSAYGSRRKHLSVVAPAICALRETHEETGILIGCKSGGNCPMPGFAEHGLVPNPSALRLLARATTPPAYPIRYEAFFFIALRNSISVSETDFGPDSELSGLIWANAQEMQSLKLPMITRWIADVALARLRDDPGLERDVPVPDFFTRSGQHRQRMLFPQR